MIRKSARKLLHLGSSKCNKVAEDSSLKDLLRIKGRQNSWYYEERHMEYLINKLNAMGTQIID